MKKNVSAPHFARERKGTSARLLRIQQAPRRRAINQPSRALRVRRVLVPVDFSKPSSKAIRYAASFARQFGAKVTLLHVCPVPYYPAELGGFPIVIPQNEPSAAWILERLEAEAHRLIPSAMRCKSLVRVGAAFDEISKAARELRSDLIIIATHGHTGLKHVLLGSTAERVVRHAPCPVLVVREAGHNFV